jgi:hypothetical protein
MQIEVEPTLRNRAKTPHELFMANLFAFHLLLTPALLALGVGEWGLVLPPSLSGMVIGYTYLRARSIGSGGSWFVGAHWRLAFKRYKLLLIAYGITAAIMLLGWWASTGIARHETQEIMLTVLTRIGIMPTLVMVFVTAVLESGGIYQAGRGEVPDDIARAYPPPDA